MFAFSRSDLAYYYELSLGVRALRKSLKMTSNAILADQICELAIFRGSILIYFALCELHSLLGAVGHLEIRPWRFDR